MGGKRENLYLHGPGSGSSIGPGNRINYYNISIPPVYRCRDADVAVRATHVLEQLTVVADPSARGRQTPGGGHVRALGLVERHLVQAQQVGATVCAVRARHLHRAGDQRQPERRGQRERVAHYRRPAQRAAGLRYLVVQPDQAAAAHYVPVRAQARHARGQRHAHRALQQPAHPFADVFDHVRLVRCRGHVVR